MIAVLFGQQLLRAIVVIGYLLPTVVYRCFLALVALGSGHLSHLSLNQFRRKKFTPAP
jgi:hypothetical protein